MAVYIPDTSESLIKKIGDHQTRGFPDWARSSVQKLRSEILGVENGEIPPVIVTGHQPIFYHPGILAKDLFSHFLAREAGGIALNMIVDTDEEDISLNIPVRGKNGLLSREIFPVSMRGIALTGQDIRPEYKEAILHRLSEYRKELYRIFVPSLVPQIREDLDSLIGIMENSKKVCEPGILLREMWEKNHSIRLKTIYTSRIIQSDAFLVFKEYIMSRESEFRRIYNEALLEYRTLHRIKNKAQPLPDLREDLGELPFWHVQNGKRMPFVKGNRITDSSIYPRAVALTLFCRIFISDLMIHGTGGARYDQITDRILERFFQFEAAPFSVATATLSLDVRADYAVEGRDISLINRDLRTCDFDPVHFLPDGNPMKIKKMDIIKRRSMPGEDLGEIHKELQSINVLSAPSVSEFRESLMKEKKRAGIVMKNNLIRMDRTFPFIFYNIQPLVDSVKKFVEGRAGIKTPAV